MIVFDTETTDLPMPEAAPIEQQPHIVEFAGIKLDDKTLKEVGRIEFLCKPPVIIPPESVKITGITNEMVKGKPPFVSYIPLLVDFFLGERVLVAHNLSFDVTILRYSLSRYGRVTSFPWPPTQVCSVELTIGLKGYRLNLGALYEIATGRHMAEAHRAMKDTEHLVEVCRWFKKKNMLPI